MIHQLTFTGSELNKIPDPAIRAVMGTVLAESRMLRGEVSLPKAKLGQVRKNVICDGTENFNPFYSIAYRDIFV